MVWLAWAWGKLEGRSIFSTVANITANIAEKSAFLRANIADESAFKGKIAAEACYLSFRVS